MLAGVPIGTGGEVVGGMYECGCAYAVADERGGEDEYVDGGCGGGYMLYLAFGCGWAGKGTVVDR